MEVTVVVDEGTVMDEVTVVVDDRTVTCVTHLDLHSV